MPKYLSKSECLEEVKKNYVAKLGYILKDCPFIVPITYYFDESDNCILAYSVQGHKIEGMRKNTTVCLYIDSITSVKKWKSVLIHGAFEELSKPDAAFYLNRLGEGIRDLLNDKEDKETTAMGEFSNVKFTLGEPIVYRINIWDIAGRYMD
jgi:nitroimidazol reductase NimA-like FMN-containing flavoprotein (pyridoxamine 5'-phosphate oxidase superfamily)